MPKQYGEKTASSYQVSCAYECGSWAELQPGEGDTHLEALGWHNPGGDRWHCPDCHAKDCVLLFKKVGVFHDVRDAGLHLECLGVKGPRRFQTISRSLLEEKKYRKLLDGERVALREIREEDLLDRIAS